VHSAVNIAIRDANASAIARAGRWKCHGKGGRDRAPGGASNNIIKIQRKEKTRTVPVCVKMRLAVGLYLYAPILSIFIEMG